MDAGKLVHVITVQAKTEIVDPNTGYRTDAWVDRVVNEPAAWLAGPGREYLAAEGVRAETSGRFVIRWSTEAAAIQPSDRVLWDGRTMALTAPPLPDATARKELTLMVTEAGTDGA